MTSYNGNSQQCVKIDKTLMQTTLEKCLHASNLAELHQCVKDLHEKISACQAFACPRTDVSTGVQFSDSESKDEEEMLTINKSVLLADLQQILNTHTISRSKYYIQRLKKGTQSIRTNGVNDINLYRWKEYDDVLTDSLWLINHRDRTGVHNAEYWGNFIPQIPYQMLLRFTKRGEWVLDPFVGSGTTLIECRHLGRHGIGIELNPDVVDGSIKRLNEEENVNNVQTHIVTGDSTEIDYSALLKKFGIEEVQLLIMHPPYHDIIRFSDDERDLSNKPTIDAFIDSFSCVVQRTRAVLAPGRYLVVVIGDKYMKGEWIPLGFYIMQSVMQQGYTLKSIIIKNYEQTKGKRDQTQLWRYRALVGGFYIFKHEYIYVFQKSML